MQLMGLKVTDYEGNLEATFFKEIFLSKFKGSFQKKKINLLD